MASVLLPLIRGNEEARRFFERAFAADRVSHAYLLVGPDPGVALRFARELAKVVYCSERVACGRCAGCEAIEHGNHPNVNVYAALEGKSQIEIDTIRALCERTHYRSSGLQVAILAGADRLNEPAANALLKTLEEPPGSALLLLTAQSTGTLLATIVSRCHRVSLRSDEATIEPLPQEAAQALGEVTEPRFFAHTDVKSWTSRALPGEEGGTRPVLKRLINWLIADTHSRLGSCEGLALDDSLRRLEVLLELRGGLDHTVNPELILERLFRLLRKGH